MSYIKFKEELENVNVKNKDELDKFINGIDIDEDNFDDWVDNIQIQTTTSITWEF